MGELEDQAEDRARGQSHGEVADQELRSGNTFKVFAEMDGRILTSPPADDSVSLQTTGHCPHLETGKPRIPKGFHQSAQGCEARATLGKRAEATFNPNGVASALRTGRCNLVGVEADFIPSSQGSSCLATLGWVRRSLWDWAELLCGIVGNAQSFGGRAGANC
jgi:hypothetical protein